MRLVEEGEMAVHVVRMREMRTACRTLVGKLEAKKPRDQGSIFNWAQREQLSGSMKLPRAYIRVLGVQKSQMTQTRKENF
jgi:hypothetical protein